eukprot:CAMPEP_0202919530 /NCGR_PEP_ID=MMETSP1392-20130828/76072_1 /ASSEMBLY_ACC=CAM_ASM_000868 /TAXON_ID=225041 /ORGANISM="Chlamydomonas chlamydogama, Strain SAG 11-48b" /LENGTH=47 /DNA_ID= /DNA_START= /DNA_END= /DNA_ORIENTATION=
MMVVIVHHITKAAKLHMLQLHMARAPQSTPQHVMARCTTSQAARSQV